VHASFRADVTGAEELCRRAADASARQDTPDWRVEETLCAARQNIAITTGAFEDAARLAEQAAGLAQVGGDLADASVELAIAAAARVFAGDAPGAVPLASEALALARQIRAPALIASGLLAVGLAVADTDPGPIPRQPARKLRAQHRARLPERPWPAVGDRDRLPHQRPGRHARARPPCHPRPPVGR
jgi:hypothetical protein